MKQFLSFWYFEVFTTGGNAGGKPCKFPFKYNNFDHYQCTYEDSENYNNQRWCRTNDDSEATLEWGNCPGFISMLELIFLNLLNYFKKKQIATQQEENGCDKVGYQSIDGGQNCYKLVKDLQRSWDDANNFCKADGGNLISIRDGFEQAHVLLLKTGSTRPEWIGLRNVNFFSQKF